MTDKTSRHELPIGARFGRLVVIAPATIFVQGSKRRASKVQCDCGNVEVRANTLLRNGKKTMCRACGNQQRDDAMRRAAAISLQKRQARAAERARAKAAKANVEEATKVDPVEDTPKVITPRARHNEEHRAQMQARIWQIDPEAAAIVAARKREREAAHAALRPQTSADSTFQERLHTDTPGRGDPRAEAERRRYLKRWSERFNTETRVVSNGQD